MNSPMVNMTAPKVPAPLRNSVDLDAIPALLAACQNLRDKLVVSLLAGTGLRLSELASLRVGAIELSSNSMKTHLCHIHFLTFRLVSLIWVEHS